MEEADQGRAAVGAGRRLIAASLGAVPAQPPAPSSRAPRSRTAEALDLLRRNRDFRLMFFAQLISLGGDRFLSVALFGLVFEFTGSPALVSALIATMSVPYAAMTFVGGPLADRVDRRRLMIVADVVRGVLAFGFFFVRGPSTVWLAFVLVGVIQSLGAFFEPAAAAAVPNLVEPDVEYVTEPGHNDASSFTKPDFADGRSRQSGPADR